MRSPVLYRAAQATVPTTTCIGLFCRTIDRQSPHFLKALTATASIQLEHKRDPAAYVHCYSQLAEEHADYESYRLLGAALMRIQEPEKAIKVRLPPSVLLLTVLHCPCQA